MATGRDIKAVEGVDEIAGIAANPVSHRNLHFALLRLDNLPDRALPNKSRRESASGGGAFAPPGRGARTDGQGNPPGDIPAYRPGDSRHDRLRAAASGRNITAMNDADAVIAAVERLDAAMRRLWEAAPDQGPGRSAIVVARQLTRRPASRGVRSPRILPPHRRRA